jgi:DNA modification methylase
MLSVCETQAQVTNFLERRSSVDYLLFDGDASEVLKAFPAGCVDMVITSPPYWAVRRYSGNGQIGTEPTPELYTENLMTVLHQVKRVLKPIGSFWLNIGDTYHDKNLAGIPWRVAFALQAEGWILRNAIIWDKVKGNPCNAKDKLRNMYEYVFHFVQQPVYYYDIDAIRQDHGQPYYKDGRIVTPTGVSGVKYEQQIKASNQLSPEEKMAALAALNATLEKVRNGELYDFRMVIRGFQRTTHSNSSEVSGRADELDKKGFYILPYHRDGSKPGDVWRIIPEDEQRKDSHYAVFPAELCELPIKATCPPGGIVLDPFVGTGTAMLRALELGRRAIGIDTSEEYLAVAERRLASFVQQPSLF